MAAVVLGAVSSVRSSARDARRVADIRNIQTALQVYYMQHGHYPVSSSGWGSPHPNSGWANSANSSWEVLEEEMGVTLPRDPVNQTGGWAADINRHLNYSYLSSPTVNGIRGCPEGQAYQIVYRLEKGDAQGGERGGMVNCNDGQTYFRSYGAINVGVSPAQ